MIIPMPLPMIQRAQPFDDPDWLYEIKHDGFRALAVIEGGRCRFFSGKKHRLTGFRGLAETVVENLPVASAILDGELAARDESGRTMFTALMERDPPVLYFAFDLLWLNGADLRSLPLLVRKQQLAHVIPPDSHSVLYVDHTRGAGTELFRFACQSDLAGIVAKRVYSLYEEDDRGRSWLTIANPGYSRRLLNGRILG
jgi:bifunctional non-homologous end joining protein LigD